jgi:PEP-CTERM motif
MSRRRLALLLILFPSLLGLGAFATVWQRSGATSEEPELSLSEPQVLPEVEVEDAVPARSGSAPAVPSMPIEAQSAPAATQTAPAVTETPQDPGEVSGAPLFAQGAGIAGGGEDPGIVRLADLRAARLSGYLSDGTDWPGSRGANAPGSKGQPDGSNTGEDPNQSTPDRSGKDGTSPQLPPSEDDPPGEEPLPDPTPDDDYPPHYPPDGDDPHEQPVQVPEPATLGLLVLGLLGCAVRRRTA